MLSLWAVSINGSETALSIRGTELGDGLVRPLEASSNSFLARPRERASSGILPGPHTNMAITIIPMTTHSYPTIAIPISYKPAWPFQALTFYHDSYQNLTHTGKPYSSLEATPFKVTQTEDSRLRAPSPRYGNTGQNCSRSEVGGHGRRRIVINPYEEYALEQGVQLKEKYGGEVSVLTLGPERSTNVILKALALGADKAIHLKSENFPDDPSAVARAIAAELKTVEFDVVLFGKKGVDDDNQQVGPMVAELLGIPCVTQIVKLDISAGKATAHREVEGGLIVVEATLP